VLAGPARVSAGAIGPEYKRSFTSSAILLSFLWLLYPIAWGLADGGSVIHPDGEMIFYGVLDVLAKPVFILWHLFSLSKLDLTALQLSSGKFTSSATTVGRFDREKNAGVGATGPNANAMTGTTTAANPGGKTGGIFARRGQMDATAPVNTAPAAPRTSEATVA
jgi:hypothetical protein